MTEELLNPEEIENVLKESSMPDWLIPDLLGIGNKKTSIVRVLPDEGLIMIKGNEHTGMNHITHRHRFNRQVWEKDRDKINISSELRYGTAPYDYLLIARSVYKPENLRPDLNKRPDNFDCYFGLHQQLNGDLVEYYLFTYKGTGIVHTLYPKDTQNPSKRLRLYRQGGIGWEENLMRATFTYTIPYRDKLDRVVFTIVVRGLRDYPFERWYIEVGEGNDVCPQTVFVKEIVLHSSTQHGFLEAMSISDSSKYKCEQLALQILEGRFDYEAPETLHTLENRRPGTKPTYFSW